MAVARQEAPRRDGVQTQRGQVTVSRWRQFLLWYWAFALPRNGRWIRTIVIHPLLGGTIALLGLLAALLRWLEPPIALGMFAAGLVILALTYPLSHIYYTEYPGKYNARLKEYVARRVSRLSKDEFIPQYKTHDYPANEKINLLNHQVRRALRVELARLAQSAPAEFAPICGILVIGPKHANKTGALWDAMAHELKGWTFVRWPHHMDHPANLARRLGHRIVLWIDNLHDFAHPGEAAALAQFVQQVRESGRQLMVLTSCRDGHRLQETERFLRPLTSELRRVPAKETLPLTERLEQLKTAYLGLAESQKSILRTIEWLRAMRVYTFPEEVLLALRVYFLNARTNQDNDPTWNVAIQGLADPAIRFVRVDRRIEAETRLSDDPYTLVNKIRFNVLDKLPYPHRVVEPINSQYINPNELEGSQGEHVQKITAILERQPDAVIAQLAGSLPAAETLILLGDAYLNHLGETIENAAELAIKCYAGALQQLDTGEYPKLFPGAWAAALIGKGMAELRMARLQDADGNFRRVTHPSTVLEREAQVPAMLLARAWHGRGDVISAQIPGDIATWIPQEDGKDAIQQFRTAAEHYKKAIDSLAPRDPLLAEVTHDRANMLYLIAQSAMKKYEQSLSSTPRQPPISEVEEAQIAYRTSQLLYSQAAAPAVWAEIQRRQGELGLMVARFFLPPDMLWPRVSVRVATAVVDPRVNLEKALEESKVARDYFIAARNIFSPSYLPMDWAQTQIGLVRALLIIARIVATSDPSQADALYRQCLQTTEETARKIYTRAESPIDWLDLQLLRAEAEFGLGTLDTTNALAQYDFARKILGKADTLLTNYLRLPEDPTSERLTALRDVMARLSEKVKQASAGG